MTLAADHAAVGHSAAMTQHDADEPEWRLWWRRGFAAFLAFALLLGLYLSFRPAGFEDEPELAGQEEPSASEPAPATPTSEPAPTAGTSDPAPEPTEDEGLTPEQAEDLIAAARPPEETSVQLLDAGGGSDAVNEAAEVLRELGYDVVAINPSRTEYDTTTVLFTDGNQTEAQALPARDERFAAVAPNERLSDGVDVHVVVGTDWES